jgi:hypothetical protein
MAIMAIQITIVVGGNVIIIAVPVSKRQGNCAHTVAQLLGKNAVIVARLKPHTDTHRYTPRIVISLKNSSMIMAISGLLSVIAH